MVRGRVTATILCIASALLPGCAFHSGAAEERAHGSIGAVLAPDQWPARETSLLDDMVRLAPTSLTLAYPVSTVVNGKLVTDTRATPVSVVRTGVYGRGIVRQFDPLAADPKLAPEERDLTEHLFGGLQFVSFPADANAVRVASAVRNDENPARYRRFLLRRLGIRAGRDETYYLMRQGTRMRAFEPLGGEPRGVVLHLSSLAGFDYEKPVIDALCEDGWLVLQIDASTARRPENPTRVDASADVAEPARDLARAIDNRVAEIAYAAEAGLDYLLDTRSDLADRPVMVAGYSAGALVGPAVATLLHDRIDGVVLVGGGANLLSIARRSSLTNGGISVRWEHASGPENTPTEADWARLEDAYLTASRLDPYNTAPFLVDKPVLVLHGLFDDIVPADTGETLYERLGRPERYVYTLGHRGLFWRLPAQSGIIRRWLDEHGAKPESKKDQAGAGESKPPIGGV
jgi:pimeloyl-ACP methyl ester carboxylesterase